MDSFLSIPYQTFGENQKHWRKICKEIFAQKLSSLVKDRKIEALKKAEADLDIWERDCICYWEPLYLYRWQLERARTLLKLAMDAASSPNPEKPSDLPTGWEGDIFSTLLGCPRQAASSEKMQVFLVDTDRQEGYRAHLTVELVPQGRGEIYMAPAPDHLFLHTDEAFQEGLRSLRQYFESQGQWPDSCDMRWHLYREDGHSLPLIIAGPSLGGAFGILFWKLIGESKGSSLSDLDLDEIGATAEFGKNGEFSSVGGLWEKLGSVCDDSGKRGMLRVVLVAENQGVPEYYLRADSEPQVIPVSNLNKAIDVIRDYQKAKDDLRKRIRDAFSTFRILTDTVKRENHYLPLPLLRKVEIEGESLEEGEEIEPGQILLDEESWRGKKFKFVPLEHSLKELLLQEKKFLLLGAPGRGKTEFLRDLSYRMACLQMRLNGKHYLPVFIGLRDWENKNLKITSYLALTEPYSAIFQKQWEKWLKEREVMLFLDGLDEISGITGEDTFFENHLYPLLDSEIYLILSCRTFTFEQYRALSKRMAIYYLDCLDEEKRNQFIHQYPCKKDGSYNSAKLIGELDRNPSMAHLSTSPLLLSIICFLVDSTEIDLPATRTQFYREALKELLKRARASILVHWPGRKPDWRDKLQILRQLVWQLWKRNPKRLVHEKEPVEATLLKILGKRADYQSDSVGWRNAFLDDLDKNSGLLRKEGKDLTYSFLHLTFLEYLISSHLSKPLKKKGFLSKPLKKKGFKRVPKVVEIIRQYQEDPLWGNVMSFLSEQQGEFRDRVIYEERRTVPGFEYLRTKTHSCGGQEHTVHEYLHTSTGMEFVLIPGGYYLMGSDEWDDSRPIHLVKIKPFLMSKTVVTQVVWKKVMGSEPWRGEDGKLEDYVQEGDRHPAVYVSWEMAKKFCKKIGLALPTESQWEYACRAGTGTPHYWGNAADGEYMWFYENARKIGEGYAHEVAKKKPNAFGLYDMVGNVWEWCADSWNSNYNGTPNDGKAWDTSGSHRVDRGGSWRSSPGTCESGYRGGGVPSRRSDRIGVRLVRPV